VPSMRRSGEAEQRQGPEGGAPALAMRRGGIVEGGAAAPMVGSGGVGERRRWHWGHQSDDDGARSGGAATRR
jgi:hypothetical protein